MEWRRAGLRRLFPSIEKRVAQYIEEGRRELALGQLLEARAAFEEASSIDADDMDTRSFLGEVDQTLELSRQLARRRDEGNETPGEDSWTELESQLSPEQHRALETQLESERALRDELLVTLEALGAGDDAPEAATLASLRPGRVGEADEKGPIRARASLEATSAGPAEPTTGSAALDTRVLYGPDGGLMARYYFAEGEAQPLLKEEDSSGDGELDRWVAYRAGKRKEVWEERRGGQLPDLHMVYDDEGKRLERIELDHSRDGWPEQLFIYRDARLRSESRDTIGDGRYDKIEHFDEDGRLALREEDLNHDGQIDVRTAYRNGRMVRREIMNPEIVSDLP
jgi:hypothetical protein